MVPFTFFNHREDSEPERVASRNRLAPTQPLSSSKFANACPTKPPANDSYRSERESVCEPPVTIDAFRCVFASRSAATTGEPERREQPGGRQTDGFRRTIGHEKNQRGVWEHLK